MVFDEHEIGGDILAKCDDPLSLAGALGLGLPDARLFSAALKQLCAVHGANNLNWTVLLCCLTDAVGEGNVVKPLERKCLYLFYISKCFCLEHICFL